MASLHDYNTDSEESSPEYGRNTNGEKSDPEDGMDGPLSRSPKGERLSNSLNHHHHSHHHHHHHQAGASKKVGGPAGCMENGEIRTKRRMKRYTYRQSNRVENCSNGGIGAMYTSWNNSGGAGGHYVVPHRRWKNSRRSRNGYGRGLPKKGGAGGKGVWGLPGSEVFEEIYEDENDPNYDSETNDKNIILSEVIPEISPEELFKQMEPIILEYYEHGDTHEVALNLDEILTNNLRPHVTSVMVEIAMDHKDSQREMTSVLISDLYGRVIIGKDIESGFEMLLKNLPDLILDTPEAPVILGNFMARAVADDCIPPKFITSPLEYVKCNPLALTAIRRAETLLHMKQGWAHLDNVWGMGGPLRPVKTISKQMTLLLKEYLSSRDIDEAHRCLRALEVPHFHHELVYEIIVMTLESLSQTTEEAMRELLASLDKSCLVLPASMEQGFLRVFDDMADIVLDVPLAYIILDRFIERCNSSGFLTEKILRNMPSRGRKRFVSEGDCNHVKQTPLPLRRE